MSKQKFAFDKTNFILLAVAMAVGRCLHRRTLNRIFLVQDVLKLLRWFALRASYL